MTTQSTESTSLDQRTEDALARLSAGDLDAIDHLLDINYSRLQAIFRLIFAGDVKVGRYEQTIDVFHVACLKLKKALRRTVPESAVHFRRTAALHFKWILKDLHRHYYRPNGIGTRNETWSRLDASGSNTHGGFTPGSARLDPAKIAQGREVLRAIEELPEIYAELFELLHFKQMTQREAAAELGVRENTVNARWQKAREMLRRRLGEDYVD